MNQQRSRSSSTDARPNILLILTDQQSASMMGCAGNRYVRTPAMDSLAASGVRFNQAYCANPVCIPSRFTLFTGRMPSEIRLKSNDLAGVDAIPETIKKTSCGTVLRGSGYTTVYAGKQHLPKTTAEELGFSVLEMDERDRLAESCASWLAAGPHNDTLDKPFFLVASFINPHDICYLAIRDSQGNEWEKKIVSTGDEECRTLDMALQRPPGISEERFFSEFCLPLPDNFEPQQNEPEAIQSLLDKSPFRRMAREEWTEKRWREHRWAYARLTEMVDAQISIVLKALKDSAYADNTVVIFTSDHGDMSGSHRLEQKIALYDEACRIPLIIAEPGQTRAAVQSTIVSNGLDLLPTLCDYAGIRTPFENGGISLRPLLKSSNTAVGRKTVPIESEFGRAVASEEYLYAIYSSGDNKEQLYDKRNDPGQTRNAIHDPELKRTVDQMRKEFKSYFND